MSDNVMPMDGYGLTTSERNGLTKRELFAAMAMQGMLADWDCATMQNVSENISDADFVSHAAVLIADALLVELAKERSE